MVVVVVVLTALVAPGVDGGPCRVVTSLSWTPSASRTLWFRAVAPGSAGGDKNSMLGGRGLGCGRSGFGGEDTPLRGDSCLDPDRAEDGDVGGEAGCSSPLATVLVWWAGAGDGVTGLPTSCFSCPLLSVRACFDVRGVVLSGEWGPVLAGLALLQSSFGTVAVPPGATLDLASAGPGEGVIASLGFRVGFETVFSVACAL